MTRVLSRSRLDESRAAEACTACHVDDGGRLARCGELSRSSSSPDERDGLGIEHSGDIMGNSGGNFSAIHPVVAIRR